MIIDLDVVVTDIDGKETHISCKAQQFQGNFRGKVIDTDPQNVGETGYILYDDGNGWQYTQLSLTTCTPQTMESFVTWRQA